MSVISGLINNGDIIISADTLLAHLSNAEKSKHGFNKIFRFTLKPNTYIIATGGLGEHVGKFLDIIQKQPFPVSIDKASLFVDELQNILLANKLDKITLLVAGVEDDHNLLARVKMNEKGLSYIKVCDLIFLFLFVHSDVFFLFLFNQDCEGQKLKA